MDLEIKWKIPPVLGIKQRASRMSNKEEKSKNFPSDKQGNQKPITRSMSKPSSEDDQASRQHQWNHRTFEGKALWSWIINQIDECSWERNDQRSKSIGRWKNSGFWRESKFFNARRRWQTREHLEFLQWRHLGEQSLANKLKWAIFGNQLIFFIFIFIYLFVIVTYLNLPYW